MRGERIGIIGIGAVPTRGTSEDMSYREMIFSAAMKAYEDAGITPEQVDTFVGLSEDFNEGVSIFDEYIPDQLGAVLKPVHTICGEGIQGIASLFMQLSTGIFKIGVLEAHSKLSNIVYRGYVEELALEPIFFRGTGAHPYFVAGLEMDIFLRTSGNTEEDCAEVVARFKENALQNPYAGYGEVISVEDVLSSAPVSAPLKEKDIAPQADGAIVVVLATESIVKSLRKDAIWITGIGFFTGEPHLDSRNWAHASYIELSTKKAIRMAGIRNIAKEIDILEVCDWFSYKALQHIESAGIVSNGRSGELLKTGFFDLNGELPLNLSGGYMGIGAMPEATSLYQLMFVCDELKGKGKLKRARRGMVISWRGLPTSSGAVTILEV